MIRFTSSVQVAAPVEKVWARIIDWPAHSRWIPLTTVRVTSARPDGVGATFVGRSALGPIGFDDPMEVVQWSPPEDGAPGYCRVEKHGRVVLGWAAFTVEASATTPSSRPGSPAHSTVEWTEQVSIGPAWLSRLLAPTDRLIGALGKIGFERSLRAMARELEKEVRSGG